MNDKVLNICFKLTFNHYKNNDYNGLIRLIEILVSELNGKILNESYGCELRKETQFIYCEIPVTKKHNISNLILSLNTDSNICIEY